MCGIIAVLRRPVDRVDLEPGELTERLDRAVAQLGAAIDAPAPDTMVGAARELEAVSAALHGPRGVRFLLTDAVSSARIRGLVATLAGQVDELDRALDALVVDDGTEARNAAAVRCKDAVWAIERDRLGTADGVASLVGRETGWSTVEACTQIEQALRSIDRLEVRGRDSAGLMVLVRDHGLSPDDPALAGLLQGRSDDQLLRSGAVRVVDAGGAPALAFAYKAAAEIGELGDNTAALRAAIADDGLLRLALSNDDAHAVVLGHTRWASVGIISEANAHPLDSWEASRIDGPFVAAALNGDVDNFADLKAGSGLDIWPEITTDAKVIPTLVSRRVSAGDDHLEAFRASVASFEGSVAIAATAADRPNSLMLALRGSGQALYVGLAGDAYVVASEPYGLVEETPRYVRMDGETPANPDNPNASRGQILLLDGERAGTLEGIERIAYDGTPVPVTEDDVVTAEITTRDIDRGDFPHFLLKEVTESPISFRKTLRGRLVEAGDGDDLRVVLPDESLPAAVRKALAAGEYRRILAIGQGTAHIASRGFVALLEDAADRHGVQVEAVPATELSGFRLRPDMADTLVVAISQSGTTTDTNRTVDLVRARGASVIAIVNRRGSDLTDRADGVLYTSDGRDVEMAVPSTKAFYAQIAAGYLLALAVAEQWGDAPDQELLRAIRDLPDAMVETLATRPAIAEAAHEWCPSRRYWAIVGNGTNRIAAEELRIKLSELCYKSIACDATEDKKHIDLSSEPLILVCAAGLTGSNVDDVAKEVAIYRAHKAAPIVIATEGEGRFASALAVLPVPDTHPMLAFVLATMVGHLFGYEAALAIDAQALPLKHVRAAIEEALEDGPRDGEHVLASLRRASTEPVQRFFDGLRAGQYDGHLEASTAVRIANLLRYAAGAVPLGAYQLDHGKVGTPSVLVEDLTAALTRGIDELTRPIDAIKHQAKTVTVGISRTDESLLEVALVRAVLDAGASRDRLTYATLRTLADVSPAIDAVVGHTRYRIEGDVDVDGMATITVVDRSGIALDLPLRTEANPILRGTKHQVASEQMVLVGRGRSDGRSIVIVPEVKDNVTTGITLLHVRFVDSMTASTARGVLAGYRRRLAALRDAVTETEPSFRDDLLAEIPVGDLLTQPVSTLADRWRT